MCYFKFITNYNYDLLPVQGSASYPVDNLNDITILHRSWRVINSKGFSEHKWCAVSKLPVYY